MYLGGLLAALVVLAEGLHAQVPRAEAALDTATARVGDPIRLTLTLYHDATARPEGPGPVPDPPRFCPPLRRLAPTRGRDWNSS